MASGKKTQNEKHSYRLIELKVQKLKGISEANVVFSPHRVTAIVGINGSGKSTILHALACCFKPKNATSKPYNRFSEFFTPHEHSTWSDSAFSLSYEYKINNKTHKPEPVEYGKNKRWTPVYERRPERESVYIGLQELATLSDNKGAGRFAKYVVKKSEHPARSEIIRDLSHIIGREYKEILICTAKSKEMKGLQYANHVYSEHTMGAGEKRVLSILLELHNPELTKDGILLIDELDVLLHEAAFNRLVQVIIDTAEKKKMEVVFTTHRETIQEFKDKINIAGVWNVNGNVEILQGIAPTVLSQLTRKPVSEREIWVEDNLSKIVIEVLLDKLNIEEIIKINVFGAATNGITIPSVLAKMGVDVSSKLFVLDGDVYVTEEEKRKQIDKIISGTETALEKMKESALASVRQYKLEHFFSDETKGAPEFNHKKWFDSIRSPKRKKFSSISKEIQGLKDWHAFYVELAERSYCTIESVQRSVIEDIAENCQEWDFYISDIKSWILKS